MRAERGSFLAFCLRLTGGLASAATTLALVLIYVGVVVPTSLLLRLTGRRLLEPGPEPGPHTYWCEREPGVATTARWRRQW